MHKFNTTRRPEETTDPCDYGSARAAQLMSGADSAGQLVGFALFPTIGALSDAYGRRPLLLISQLLHVVPAAFLFLYAEHDLSIYYFLGGKVVSASVGGGVIGMAYTADIVPSEQRSVAFGILLATAATGLMLAPVGANFTLGHAALAALSLHVSASLICFGLLEETVDLNPKRRHSEEQKKEMRPDRLLKAILGPKYRRYALIATLHGAVGKGLQDIGPYFMSRSLGFTPQRLGAFIVVLALTALVAQAAILRSLIGRFGELGVLRLALLSAAAAYVSFFGSAVLGSEATPFVAAATFLPLSTLSIPVLTALVANQASPAEQGTLQGSLHSLINLGQAIGLLVLPLVYRSAGAAVYLVGAAMEMLNFAIAVSDSGGGSAGGGNREIQIESGYGSISKDDEEDP